LWEGRPRGIDGPENNDELAAVQALAYDGTPLENVTTYFALFPVPRRTKILNLHGFMPISWTPLWLCVYKQDA